jgi:hypothetical protein
MADLARVMKELVAVFTIGISNPSLPWSVKPKSAPSRGETAPTQTGIAE